MRILCLNANTTAFVTETVAGEVRSVLGPDVTVIEATGDFGPAVVRTHLDHAVATHAAVDLAARHGQNADAVLVAVSFDLATEAIREALGVPVVGMSEASIAMARILGRRIGYVSIGAASTPLYRDAFRRHDIDRDLAGWRAVDALAAYAPGDKTAVDALVRDTAAGLATAGADVVVLLGAVFAGMARRLGPDSPVPLVDGGLAGGLMAEALGRLGPGARSGRRTLTSVMTGVGPELAALADGSRLS